MWTNKPTRPAGWILASLAISAGALAQSNPPPSDAAPVIDPVDQRFLTRWVRQTIAARLADAPPPEPGYIPPALTPLQCQIVVTLRESGYARGIGTSPKLPIMEAASEAARVALSSARAGTRDDLESLDGIRIEMQALGPVVPYRGSQPWTAPQALEAFVEPGVDGVRLFLDGEGRWFTPGEMISRGLSLTEAVRILGQEITLDSSVLSEATCARFRTTHWWELDARGRVATLERGLVWVAPNEVTRHRIDRTIADLAAYIRFRQRPDGWFAATFDPASDRFSDESDAGMQAGACWALAVYARRNGDGATLDVVDRGLRAQHQWVVNLGRELDASFIASEGGDNTPDVTAEHLLALIAHPRGDRYAALRDRLVRALVWLQRDDGSLLTVFPPTRQIPGQQRIPGMVLTALAADYADRPTAEVADVFASALRFYQSGFARSQPLAMTAWHARAFATMARLGKRADYARFVFALCDRLCACQLGAHNVADRVVWGAFADGDLRPGSATAAFVAALAEGARLADERGDRDRAQRYRTACRAGVRFILQLQFRAEECYYVRSPQAVIGGIRTAPTNVRLHLSSGQHSLLALMACRDLLFPTEP